MQNISIRFEATLFFAKKNLLSTVIIIESKNNRTILYVEGRFYYKNEVAPLLDQVVLY